LRTGPASHRNDVDFVDEIASEIEGKKDQNSDNHLNLIAICPHIRVVIAGQHLMALLDTGSQISVSESFYKQLVTQNRIKELPVTSLVVSTAIDKKSTPINVKFSLK